MEKETDIVLVRLKNGETHPANRVNLSTILRSSQETEQLLNRRPGEPTNHADGSWEVKSTELATDQFRKYGSDHQR